MIYKTFKELKLSALGMGCMRLPVKGDKFDQIDVDAATEMIDYAMQHGINYYDTGWGYHDGNSETVMGSILKKYSRNSFYFANKYPGYDLNNMGKVKEIFEEQLKKCQMDYFDFYLFHNVCELTIDGYLDPKFGIFDYLMEQKKAGRIRHLGFSTHGTLETMQRFLDTYGEHMEFCQIQLNWLDWEFQNAKAKIELLDKYNIPVLVMEPLRGGSLTNLPTEHQETLHTLSPEKSIPEWAFRFIQGIPSVMVTLSGMSTLQQLQENIATYSEYIPLTESETSALLKIASKMTSKDKLLCTSCRYCTTHCPQGLNIPWFIELYNEHVYSGGGFIAPMAMNSLDDSKKPSACLGCRLCEAVCPQNIKISEMMADFTERLK